VLDPDSPCPVVRHNLNLLELSWGGVDNIIHKSVLINSVVIIAPQQIWMGIINTMQQKIEVFMHNYIS
jgi:hypothetical protein